MVQSLNRKLKTVIPLSMYYSKYRFLAEFLQFPLILNNFFLNFAHVFLFFFVCSPADTSLLQKIIRKGLIDTKSELDIIRNDPTSPLYSAKTFEELKL